MWSARFVCKLCPLLYGIRNISSCVKCQIHQHPHNHIINPFFGETLFILFRMHRINRGWRAMSITKVIQYWQLLILCQSIWIASEVFVDTGFSIWIPKNELSLPSLRKANACLCVSLLIPNNVISCSRSAFF